MEDSILARQRLESRGIYEGPGQRGQALQSQFSISFPNLADFRLRNGLGELNVAYRFEDRAIGYAVLKVREYFGSGTVEFYLFYPHKFAETSLSRRGIGTLAQVGTLVEVIKLVPSIHPGFKVFHQSLTTSVEYKALLRKIGVELLGPIDTYVEKCLHYASSRGYHFENPFLVREDNR